MGYRATSLDTGGLIESAQSGRSSAHVVGGGVYRKEDIGISLRRIGDLYRDVGFAETSILISRETIGHLDINKILSRPAESGRSSSTEYATLPPNLI